jgi:tetratricopeptide (TPR) repeat protein
MLSETGKPQDSEATLRRAADVFEKLVGEHPEVPAFREFLIAARSTLATVLGKSGRAQEAQQILHQVVASAEKLVADFPAVPDFRFRFARSLRSLGRTLNDRPGEEGAVLRRALDIAEKLHAEQGGLPEHKKLLAEICFELSEHHAVATDPRYRDARLSIELARRAVELRPKEPGFWKNLALAEYRNGEWDAALKAAEMGLELRSNDGYVYDWTLLTLIHARRGEMEKAREWLAKVQPRFEKGEMADTPRVLYDEAAALVGIGPPPDETKPGPAGGPANRRE